ncbi:AzlC family ABC transporter permease [Oscillospiraceae bacterium MB08-C2-2]|nr:AzlC family ABC transporter permease [Oscillospiraceae bacterium MB08-C2-2]
MKHRGLLKYCFSQTIPVMTGYIFMGMAFGILLQSQGYNFLWAGLMGITVYAGSMQFVAVNLLTNAFAPLKTLLITLMVNARHIFYGFSMLERFRDTGKLKPYLVFSLTDETFSLLYSTPPPENASKPLFYFYISLLDQLYWILGCILGGLLGSQLSFNTQGIEFVMTALFASIFAEQFRAKHNRLPALIGLGGSAVCLAIFGPDHFILPAMVLMVALLTLGRKQVEGRSAQ